MADCERLAPGERSGGENGGSAGTQLRDILASLEREGYAALDCSSTAMC